MIKEVNKMKFKRIVYVIQDSESGLFVTRGNIQRRLDELGPSTQLFENKSDAMRVIEEKPRYDCDDETPTILQNELAWDLLEKVYNKPRWYIDILNDEYQDAINQFKNLKAVKLEMYVE